VEHKPCGERRNAYKIQEEQFLKNVGTDMRILTHCYTLKRPLK